MSQYIKSIDQNHLVTIGEEGWTSQGTNFIEDHSVDSIDFATFHLYPDHYGWSYAQTINWIDDRINDAHNVIGKPIVLEEMGKKQNRDSYFEGWYNELEEKGVNGDNFWILYDHTYPDYDEFGVYCPENITTCAIIANHANYMNKINRVILYPIDSGLTSPTGYYRWLDVANQAYGAVYQDDYNYSQANVEIIFDKVNNTFYGTLTATNLKPNFAYQLKLVGTAGTEDNERIGLVADLFT